MVWKLQAGDVFSVSEETKFEVDTTSITLSYLHHFGNINKELSKQHMTKLIKFSSMFPSWKILEGSGIQFWNVGNEEIDLRYETLLPWQNILNSRQIAPNIEEKLANQGDVLCGGISIIYLSLSNKWKPCHGVITSRQRNLRSALKKYFRFHWNCKQLRVETRNSMSNCESISQFSLKLYIQFWKYFQSIVLGSVGRGNCKKNRVLEFSVKIFG